MGITTIVDHVQDAQQKHEHASQELFRQYTPPDCRQRTVALSGVKAGDGT